MSKASIISIANMLFLSLLMACAYWGVFSFDAVLPYRWHKFLHLAGVVVFLGNVILGPLWVVLSFKTEKIDTIKFTFKTLQEFDIYITAPSVAMVVINGLYMGNVFGGVANSDWLKHSVFSLLVLWFMIVPILLVQDKMGKLIANGDFQSKAFNGLKKEWMAAGLFSFLPIVYICYMMVFKSID